MSRVDRIRKKMRREHEDFYRECKEALSSTEFTYNEDVQFYVEFYEIMIPDEQGVANHKLVA